MDYIFYTKPINLLKTLYQTRKLTLFLIKTNHEYLLLQFENGQFFARDIKL